MAGAGHGPAFGGAIGPGNWKVTGGLAPASVYRLLPVLVNCHSLFGDVHMPSLARHTFVVG